MLGDKKFCFSSSTQYHICEQSSIRDWPKSTGGGGGGVGRSMGKSKGPNTYDPPPFMGIKSADPPPGSG